MLFKKNLFVMAINLAKSQHLDNDGLSEIFRQYGDHLYLKGDHDGAIQQYIRYAPIWALTGSKVAVFRFLGVVSISCVVVCCCFVNKNGVF